MMNEHIHTFDDGRGQRKIFLDGKYIEQAFYADTKLGIVRAYTLPLTVVDDEICSHELRGTVTVTPA